MNNGSDGALQPILSPPTVFHEQSLSPRGFSLLEMSIVLVILSLVLAGLLPGLSAYRETTEREQARHQIEQASEALLGFAMRHGRLPCPASPDSQGIESPVGGGHCTHPWNGLLPTATLGMPPQPPSAFALDPWGNPLRYAITTFGNPACGSAPCATTENALRDIWNTATPPVPDLRVCNTATGKSGSGDKAECAADTALTKDAFAVVISLGPNGSRIPGNDESANIDADRLFVSRERTVSPESYDDLTGWLSSALFYSRLMAAGRLP